MVDAMWNTLDKEDYEVLSKYNMNFTSFRNFNKSGIDVTVLTKENNSPYKGIVSKMSFAFCGYKDRFVKKSGQKIAMGRFKKGMTLTRKRSVDSKYRANIVDFIESGFDGLMTKEELNGTTYYLVVTENGSSLHLPHKLVKSLPMW